MGKGPGGRQRTKIIQSSYLINFRGYDKIINFRGRAALAPAAAATHTLSPSLLAQVHVIRRAPRPWEAALPLRELAVDGGLAHRDGERKWSLTTAERSAPASSTLIGGGMTFLKRPYGVACGRGGARGVRGTAEQRRRA